MIKEGPSKNGIRNRNNPKEWTLEPNICFNGDISDWEKIIKALDKEEFKEEIETMEKVIDFIKKI